MLVHRQFKLTSAKALALLDELDAGGGPSTSLRTGPAATLYLPAGGTADEARPYLEQIPPLQPVAGEVATAVNASPTGAAIFWGGTRQLLISPPFPLKDKYLASGYDTAPLKTLLAREWRIGVVLVRLGSFAIGVCEGERLIEHQTGTGLVHGRQRQGGSSSNRFRRRREEQAFHFLKRVAEHAQEKLAPYAKTLDFFVYGGARTTILELHKHGRFLEQFHDRLLPPLLTIPEPRYETLKDAVTAVWTSRVTEWEDSSEVRGQNSKPNLKANS